MLVGSFKHNRIQLITDHLNKYVFFKSNYEIMNSVLKRITKWDRVIKVNV